MDAVEDNALFLEAVKLVCQQAVDAGRKMSPELMGEAMQTILDRQQNLTDEFLSGSPRMARLQNAMARQVWEDANREGGAS